MKTFTVQMSTNSDDIRLYIVEAPDWAGAQSYALRVAEEHDPVGFSWTVDMTFEGVAWPASKESWVKVMDLRYAGGGFKPLGRGAGEVG